MSGPEDVPVVDEAVLTQLAELGPGLLGELTELYDGQLRDLLPGVLSTDRDEARRAAHTLKGSSANLGLLRVARIAGDIEDGSGGGDAPERMQAAVREGLAELRARLA